MQSLPVTIPASSFKRLVVSSKWLVGLILEARFCFAFPCISLLATRHLPLAVFPVFPTRY
jgi:hypothetical protein